MAGGRAAPGCFQTKPGVEASGHPAVVHVGPHGSFIWNLTGASEALLPEWLLFKACFNPELLMLTW